MAGERDDRQLFAVVTKRISTKNNNDKKIKIKTKTKTKQNKNPKNQPALFIL